MDAAAAAPIDPSTPKSLLFCPPPFGRGQDVALFGLEVQSADDLVPARADRGLRCQRIFVKVAFGGFALTRHRPQPNSFDVLGRLLLYH